MAIEPYARRSWSESQIGTVPLGSPRGIAAALLFGLSLAATFLIPLLSLVVLLVSRSAPPAPAVTRELIGLTFLFNTLVLLILPMAAIAISRPGVKGAVARRLRLLVGRRTPLHALVGAATTFVTLLTLGLVLFVLQELGLYRAEESALTEGIESILDWSIVIALPLIAAVTEEVYFRGVLQPRIGLLAASLLFGFVHIGYGTWIQIVVPVLLGFQFGILYRKTQSLWAPIAGHFTFNFLVLLSAMLDK